MKTFVVLASCLTIASAQIRNSYGAPGLRNNNVGSGRNSNIVSSASRGSLRNGGSISGGTRSFGNPPAFRDTEFSALMSLMGVNGFGGNGGLNAGRGNGQKNKFNGAGQNNGFNNGAGQNNDFNNGFGQDNGFNNGAGQNNDFTGNGQDVNDVSAIGQGDNGNQNQQGGQVRRFVSIHVAPEEEAPREPRIIRAGGDPDTHVNIIFVKAPSVSNEQPTEVILPEAPKQRTLVYVLLKKPSDAQDNIKIRNARPTSPSKPEVYFIRYKPEGDSSNGNGNGESGSGGNGFDGSKSGGFGSGSNEGFSSSGNSGSSFRAQTEQNLGGYQ